MLSLFKDHLKKLQYALNLDNPIYLSKKQSKYNTYTNTISKEVKSESIKIYKINKEINNERVVSIAFAYYTDYYTITKCVLNEKAEKCIYLVSILTKDLAKKMFKEAFKLNSVKVDDFLSIAQKYSLTQQDINEKKLHINSEISTLIDSQIEVYNLKSEQEKMLKQDNSYKILYNEKTSLQLAINNLNIKLNSINKDLRDFDLIFADKVKVYTDEIISIDNKIFLLKKEFLTLNNLSKVLKEANNV